MAGNSSGGIVAAYVAAYGKPGDHATMLAQVKRPVLLTHHFHTTDPGTGRPMGAMTHTQATGPPPHGTHRPACGLQTARRPATMHEPMAQQYADVITGWIKTLA
ncbi:hypothetical protein ABR738_30805 [Streptomyces sp. Edi4]|uniref:hypothetical protein n=1 Tax=Streptomyces sp. Edi4 TaxID=3162527 RepID=UPI003305A6FB